MKDNHILGRYTAPAGEVEQGLGEKLLEALTVGRDAVMETFDYISDRADQDLAEMRLRSIDDALNSFSWPHTPAAPVQGEEAKAGENTPLPWTLDPRPHASWIGAIGNNPNDPQLWSVATPFPKGDKRADAELIVAAVNSYVARREESRAAYQRIDELETALRLLWKEVVASGNSDARNNGWPKACAATRQALEPFPAESGA